MSSNYLYILFITIAVISCKGRDRVEVVDVHLTEIKEEDTTSGPPPPPPPSSELKLSAYLIYNDSTTSSFDVLNDKSIALWNTIIGAGDAQKPSEMTKIVLTGKLNGLKATIYNGKKKVIDQALPEFTGIYEFTVGNTGCQEVNVIITRHRKIVYQNSIPFKCGE